MAFFDDPKILIGHLRHSFITSDDTGKTTSLSCSGSVCMMCPNAYRTQCEWVCCTVVHTAGMCELIMVNEDLDKEIKSDNTFSKRSLKMAQRL